MTLPPGQYPIDGFPRFGTHLHRPLPAVPVDPVIEISGAAGKSFALPLAKLATLPRRELTADFHCVAGWSATNLHWEGVAFETFYRMIIEPSVRSGTLWRKTCSSPSVSAAVRSTVTMARRSGLSVPASMALSVSNTCAA